LRAGVMSDPQHFEPLVRPMPRTHELVVGDNEAE
jgi:hypothetical protein